MEVREILASLGFKSLTEIIGRTDLLHQVSRGSPNLDDLDLNPLLVQTDSGEHKRYSENDLINSVPDNSIDEKVWNNIKNKIDQKERISVDEKVSNTDRTIGAKLSHYIFNKFGENSPKYFKFKFNRFSWSIIRAFLSKSITIKLTGDANDYVAKGLSGGKIIVRPSKENNLKTNENTIIGNTVLYGATSENCLLQARLEKDLQ